MDLVMSVRVRYILNQWLMGGFRDSDLPVLVEKGRITEEQHQYFLSLKETK
ncbi:MULTISPECIES: hypothetical protein [Bacillus]|uniref:hypothetical protein n=1 Tax=Bacillus TaxID=1386 RepID=UPI00159BEE0A|nr:MULTISPECIES: hypothetical protein [Bacillus]